MHTSRRDLLKGPLAWAAVGALAPLLTSAAAPRRAFAHPHPEAGPTAESLLAAIEAGDLAAVRTQLAAAPGLIHTRDAVGRSAFALALLARQPEIGALIREHGYAPDVVESALALDWDRFEVLASEAPGTVNRPHPIGGTAMHAAAIGGAGSSIWRVYQFGGVPNPQADANDPQPSPLRVALDHPDLATAELSAAALLGNGADPNGAPGAASSPLHAAAARGSEDLVVMLVRKEANLDAMDEQGRTPLALAEERGQRKVAERLRNHREIPRDCTTSRRAYDAEGNPFVEPDLSSYSLLAQLQVVGAAHFRFEEVRKAVDRHPELAKSVATTTEGAVEACAHTGQQPIVEYLLERGAPYSMPTAVGRGDLKRVREMLEEDPRRIHERGAHDFALLWYPVIGGGHMDMAALLIEHGAEVEQQDHLGTTALHWAARGGQMEMVAFLLEHGADPKRPGRKFGGEIETPLAAAEGRDHGDVARLLRDRGATR